jgi:hypothetical protein
MSVSFYMECVDDLYAMCIRSIGGECNAPAGPAGCIAGTAFGSILGQRCPDEGCIIGDFKSRKMTLGSYRVVTAGLDPAVHGERRRVTTMWRISRWRAKMPAKMASSVASQRNDRTLQ